jgi:hypothetical protein
MRFNIISSLFSVSEKRRIPEEFQGFFPILIQHKKG